MALTWLSSFLASSAKQTWRLLSSLLVSISGYVWPFIYNTWAQTPTYIQISAVITLLSAALMVVIFYTRCSTHTIGTKVLLARLNDIDSRLRHVQKLEPRVKRLETIHEEAIKHEGETLGKKHIALEQRRAKNKRQIERQERFKAQQSAVEQLPVPSSGIVGWFKRVTGWMGEQKAAVKPQVRAFEGLNGDYHARLLHSKIAHNISEVLSLDDAMYVVM